jgi:hypothetical protein
LRSLSHLFSKCDNFVFEQNYGTLASFRHPKRHLSHCFQLISWWSVLPWNILSYFSFYIVPARLGYANFQRFFWTFFGYASQTGVP